MHSLQIVGSTHFQWCYSLFSSTAEAKKCSTRGGTELKFEAIEEMLSFCTLKKGRFVLISCVS
jgi:hypothetical protein